MIVHTETNSRLLHLDLQPSLSPVQSALWVLEATWQSWKYATKWRLFVIGTRLVVWRPRIIS